MPAFPAIEQEWNEPSKRMIDVHYPGFTKREKLAGMAMQGLLANYQAQQDMQRDFGYTGSNFMDVLAENSVDFADALLRRLEK